MTTNPYAPPEASLDFSEGAQDGDIALPRGRTVEAGQSAVWISGGWDLFKQEPGTWIGLTLIWGGLMMVVVSLIPLLNLFGSVLNVFLMAGLLFAADRQRRTGELSIGDLFAAFSSHAIPLLIVGLIGVLAYFVSMLPMILIPGGSMLSMLLGGGEPDFTAFGLSFLLGFLISFALMTPVMATLWFAPPLIVLGNMHPIEALKASFIGCLRNWLPFLIYSLLMLVLLTLGLVPLGLGLLVVLPLSFASMYVSYRDIYHAD